MASPLRLRTAPAGSVTIIGTGPFGTRCAGMLAEGVPGRQAAVAEIRDAFAAGPGAVVLTLWRPEPGLCETADELSFRHGVSWLPVIMENPVIRVGPLACPPAGPCFGCYARRRGQHDGQPWATAALYAAYAGDPGCGPRGYLPHQARMAAAVAHTMLSGRRAGEVTTIRLVAGGLATRRVVGCHGCPRCGTATPAGPPGLTREPPVRDGRDLVLR